MMLAPGTLVKFYTIYSLEYAIVLEHNESIFIIYNIRTLKCVNYSRYAKNTIHFIEVQ